jgi:Tim44-like domain
MTLLRKLMIALFCAGLATAPMVIASHPAEARAGWTSRGFSSMGSLGSHTYSFNGGSAINRSVTPRGYSGYGGAYGGYRGYGYGYHPFWSGLAGGLFGGWLGSMLFPHWGYGGYGGYGMGWGGGFFSILIWIFLIWLGWRLFRGFFRGGYGGGMMGGGTMSGGGPMGFMGGGFGGPAGFGGPSGFGAPAGPTVDQIDVTPSDQTAFEAILKAVQGAWGKADLSTLRHYVTPEMLSYFSEELSQNQSEGVENHVEDIELLNGDVREAWREENLEYATVMLRWKARDWTVRNDGSNAVVEGDPNKPSEAQELWTFARSPGGHWLLSAIQQV